METSVLPESGTRTQTDFEFKGNVEPDEITDSPPRLNLEQVETGKFVGTLNTNSRTEILSTFKPKPITKLAVERIHKF